MYFLTNIYFNLVSDLAILRTLISGVPCARIQRCVARLEGNNSFIIDPFSSNNNREVFLRLLNSLIQQDTAYLLQHLPPD